MSKVVALKNAADYSHAFYELETEVREVLLAADIAFQMVMQAESSMGATSPSSMHDRSVALFAVRECLEHAQALHKKYHDLHRKPARGKE